MRVTTVLGSNVLLGCKGFSLSVNDVINGHFSSHLVNNICVANAWTLLYISVNVFLFFSLLILVFLLFIIFLIYSLLYICILCVRFHNKINI